MYNDPSLLWDAESDIPAPAIVLVEGKELIIDPFDGTYGQLSVRVAATDGIDATVQEFTVTIDKSAVKATSEQVSQTVERAQTRHTECGITRTSSTVSSSGRISMATVNSTPIGTRGSAETRTARTVGRGRDSHATPPPGH